MISSNFKLPVSYSALKNGNSPKWELLLHVMLETQGDYMMLPVQNIVNFGRRGVGEKNFCCSWMQMLLLNQSRVENLKCHDCAAGLFVTECFL